ncbi:hypothetical protein DMENIID0001_057230 [Sergentomyia squamirostris]
MSKLCSAEVAVIVLWDPLTQDYYLDFYSLYVPDRFILELPRSLKPPRKPMGRTYSEISNIVNAQFRGRRPLANVRTADVPFQNN